MGETAVSTTESRGEVGCGKFCRDDKSESAVGRRKAGRGRWGSLVIRVADETRGPGGGALAVDRVRFAQGITAALEAAPLVTLRPAEIPDL